MSFTREIEKSLVFSIQFGQENIAISTITAGELFYGALNKRELKQISQDLSNLQTFHLSKETSLCFQGLMHQYCLSHKISLPDALIAATALTEKVPLYTLNIKDFQFIEGIQLFRKKGAF